MNKIFITVLSLLPIAAFAAHTPKKFDNSPVFPTLEKLRNINWSWANIAALPNVSTLKRDTEHKGYFMQTQTIMKDDPKTTITFYGTKAKPEAAVIESRTWGIKSQEESLFVRIDMLQGNIPLQSNCNLRNLSIDTKDDEHEHSIQLTFQQLYTIPKDIPTLTPALHNLYAGSLKGENYLITSTFQNQAYTITVITPDLTKLGKYVTMYGWSTDKKGKKLNCVVPLMR